MKMIGIVQWANRDKNGNPIARVLPLVELLKTEWRQIEALEEFPTQGLVFWFQAHMAVTDALVRFRAEPNPGQRDEFKVVEPELVWEVLDVRRFGDATAVRTALHRGLRLPGPLGAVRSMLLCQPDVLIGPVDLSRAAGNVVRLTENNLARVPAYTGATIRSLAVDGQARLVRVEDSAPSGFVDWDSDAVVLKRAIDIAVRVATEAGQGTLHTKKQIEDAARALVAQGVGPDAQLDRYRLERALTLFEGTDMVAAHSTSLVEGLRAHPAIQSALEALNAKVRADAEARAREDLVKQLAAERKALKETTDSHVRAKTDLAATTRSLLEAQKRLGDTQQQVDRLEKDIQAAVDARVHEALERPIKLLADVSVLRPLMATGSALAPVGDGLKASVPIAWSRERSEKISDKASLRRVLTAAARARGVDPSLMFHIHAAVAAQFMPVTLGPAAISALAAYGAAACGSRVHFISVSPNAIVPRDVGFAYDGGLVDVSTAAHDVDGLCMAVFEGANRSPIEASLLPVLQMAHAELGVVSKNLRLAATLVVGATTVPVTPQIWSHAIAVFPEPIVPSAHGETSGDMVLSSELLQPGDAPTEAVESLLDEWPDCSELRAPMVRFGAALNRLYDESSRVTDALRDAMVLPYIATALTVEEQADVLGKVRDPDGRLAATLRSLRRRLA